MGRNNVVMFTPSLLHMHFSHFGDACNLGSNGSTKLKKSLWKAALALVLESYVCNCPSMNFSFVSSQEMETEINSFLKGMKCPFHVVKI
jgi:hypothetical protein